MSKISRDSMMPLSTADLWAMYQYAEMMRVDAQKSFDKYKEREYAATYESKLNYWIATANDLFTEIGKRINEINPMYP